MQKERLAGLDAFVIGEEASHLLWGAQYEWAKLVAPAWKSVGNDFYRISYSPKTCPGQAWWFAALHLLGFGLGWTDIAKGLEIWREEGYPVDNPILKTVHNMYGTSIEALAIWLRSGGVSVYEALSRFAKHPAGDQFARRQLSANELEQAIQTYQNRIGGPRTQAGFDNLLHGGWDPMHLTHHFVWAVENNSELDMSVLPISEGESVSDFAALVKTDNMASFLSKLDDIEMMVWNARPMPETARVLFQISSLGLIMPFTHCHETGRWFMDDLLHPSSANREVHKWGNYVF